MVVGDRGAGGLDTGLATVLRACGAGSAAELGRRHRHCGSDG